MAKQQEPDKASGFSISIVLPNGSGARQELVVTGTPHDALPEAPEYLAVYPMMGNPIDADYEVID
jgi:hypothetical protein